MLIDAHHHFWQLGRFEYPWIEPELKPLQHNFGPIEFEPILQRHHLHLTVLVQTIASVAETQWFLELCQRKDFIGGVVGWVDLADANVGATLDQLRLQPGLVGIRHLVHDEPDTGWLLREDVVRGLREVAARALPYDLLIRPPHLAASCTLARQLPELQLVVDHMAKPEIASHGWQPWATGLKKLAQCENVFCKISGLVTEADWENWRVEELKPYVQHAIECFGPSRLMYGSDWPVCLLASTYDRVIEAAQACISVLSPSEQSQIMGVTAARFYNLPATADAASARRRAHHP